MSLPNASQINRTWPIEIKPANECPSNEPTPNLAELSDVTLFLFGVPSSVQMDLFGCGLYNEVYLLTLDVPSASVSTIPRQVIARISRPAKARSDISMESEITTMLHVKRHTSIPVPTVFGYCQTETNPVGLPFMIMELMEGVNMGFDAWQQSSLENKLIGIRDYARMVVELSRLRFDSIGSLYPGTIPGSVKPGPIAWPKFDTAHRRNLPIYDRGPWKSATAWLQASLTDTIQSMKLIPDLARIAPMPTFNDEKRWQLAHTLLPRCLNLVPEVVDEASDPYSGQFALAHMDLTPWNCLYYNSGPNIGKISAVLDWEMAATVPLWQLVTIPWWMQSSTTCYRDPTEIQAFEDTYFDYLQAEEPELARLARAAPLWKRQFAEAVILPWSPALDNLQYWIKTYGTKFGFTSQSEGGSV